MLSIYLLAATKLNELFKLHVLIEHFQETKKEGNTITFLNFLVMHYLTDDLNDKDNDRDMQLPFKSNEIYISGSDTNGIPVYLAAALVTHTFTSNENYFIINLAGAFPLTDYHFTVWHPPKLYLGRTTGMLQ